MATAGKVAPTPKDKFVNGTAYDKLDVVEYNGTLYIAKKASAGVLPTDTEYWMLAVDLTGKLDTTGDTQNNTVTFTSGDATDPTAWQNVTVMSSKDKHSSLLNKISTMFSNVRYLYKLLGTTDISALGTVTQALANLDGNVGDIKGIISSLADCSAATVAGYAADALAVKELSSNLGTWEDITHYCNLGYHQTTTGKIYKNSTLRLISVKLWFSENIGNQEYLCTVGTLPGGSVPEILTFSVNTQDTSGVDNPSIILLYDSIGLRSSHSIAIQAILPVYTALLKY